MSRPPTHLTLVPASAPRSKEGREGDCYRQEFDPVKMGERPQSMKGMLVLGHPLGDVFAATTVSKLFPHNSDIIKVDFGDYLGDLRDDLAAVCGRPGGPEFTWSATETDLPTNVAITFVRVADLLITKSFVHAFPPGEGGCVDVSFTVDHNAWRLTIEDNGMPIQSFVDQRCDGLATARLLVLRHHGWLEMSDVTGGTRCIVTIPKSDPESAANVEAKSILGSLKAADWRRDEL